MFDLSTAELSGRILGCGDGPASFNQEMTALGRAVISVDPLYVYAREKIQERVEETYQTIISQVRQNADRYVWSYFANADDLGRARLAAMLVFLEDYASGLQQGRYIPASLPHLPFQRGIFNLALCSHLLFLYSEQLTLEFHIASLAELLRVANEVRIFPLLGLDCRTSPHLAPIQAHFQELGYSVEVVRVPYEFQRGGDAMLRLAHPE